MVFILFNSNEIQQKIIVQTKTKIYRASIAKTPGTDWQLSAKAQGSSGMGKYFPEYINHFCLD